MDQKSKNRVLTWLVILLLIANATSIAMFWLGNKKQQPTVQNDGTPATFLINALTLNTQQQQQLEVFRQEHKDAVEPLREQLKVAKKKLFNLLKQTIVTDSAKQIATKNISAITQQIDVVTFDHFKKARAICTPEQQKKFDEIIEEVTNIITNPRPPRRENDSEGDRPPHDKPDGDRPPPPRN